VVAPAAADGGEGDDVVAPEVAAAVAGAAAMGSTDMVAFAAIGHRFALFEAVAASVHAVGFADGGGQAAALLDGLVMDGAARDDCDPLVGGADRAHGEVVHLAGAD